MSENIKNLTKNISINWYLLFTLIVTAFGIAVSSQISIPMPNGVPMTLQTFSVALAGFCLYKNNKGLKAITTYLLLGLLGMPVFAQGKSGIASILGLTGGFLIGFIFLVYCCQKAKYCNSFWAKIIVSLTGVLLLHIFGVLQYSILTGNSFINSALLVSSPFLLKDGLSILLALMISSNISNIYFITTRK